MAERRGKSVKKTRTVTVTRRVEVHAGWVHECEWCGETFEAKRSDARFCSDTCRQNAHRDKKQRERG